MSKEKKPKDDSKPVVLSGKDAEAFKKQHADKLAASLGPNAVTTGKPKIGKV